MIDTTEAARQLEGAQLVVCGEGSVTQARELERRLLEGDIPTRLAAKPKGACCSGGGCACGPKVQLLVRSDDLSRVSQLLQADWLEAVRREGMSGGLVQLGVPSEAPSNDEQLRCPACGFAGELVGGACGDCGLQLE